MPSSSTYAYAIAGVVSGVLFGAAWCPACRALLPRVKRLAKRWLNLRCAYLYLTADTEEVYDQFDVSALPTVVIFDADGCPVDSVQCTATSIEELAEKVALHHDPDEREEDAGFFGV